MNKKQLRLLLLAVAVVLVGAIIWYVESMKVQPGESEAVTITTEAQTETAEEKAQKYERAKEITTPTAFINTDGVTMEELVGDRVVLVDFWTYSCINCQRTLPYLNAWHEKYADEGLTIVGVHTPEFAFEEKEENVRAAVEKFNITYPVVMDNDYSTWRAYRNRFWPRKYLVDIDGFIVYDHIGEGGYEETERQIQSLLRERKEALGLDIAISDGFVDPERRQETDFDKPRSPETYFGADRNNRLENGEVGVVGEQALIVPEDPRMNRLYLGGTWNITQEHAQSASTDAKIVYRYQAKNVYFVARADEPVRARVLVDGAPITSELAGEDVTFEDGEGFVEIKEDRLYELITNEAYNQHTLELIFEEPGVQAFTFTFG